ncbi:MAG: hypothetical protein E6J91_40625 [Deltaproteobacteria bacterium]|nr:MAG: hypothetical protein E6J91_40625 [Deltaproteobacteria bacterium]
MSPAQRVTCTGTCASQLSARCMKRRCSVPVRPSRPRATSITRGAATTPPVASPVTSPSGNSA